MRKLTRIVGTTLCLGIFAACAPSSDALARVLNVSVRDDQGQPLGSVAVAIDGLIAIKTGKDGMARISLSPRGAPRARLAVSCPEGSREAAPRHVPRVVTGGTGVLDLSFRCRPALRELVVVVRAPGAEGLWLRADGEPLGRVASDGTLHVLLRRAPDSEVHLLLDTGDLPLTPPNPVRELRVADRDELVIFDQPVASTLRTRATLRAAARSRTLVSTGSRAEELRAASPGSRAEEPGAVSAGSRAEEPRAAFPGSRAEELRASTRAASAPRGAPRSPPSW